MKKYFLFSVSLIFSVLLLPMDKKQLQDSFLVTLFSQDVAQRIERSLSLPDINRLRCVHKGTYFYWNVNKVASSAQINDKDHACSYNIREAILASCSDIRLFDNIWNIDGELRDADFTLFCKYKNSQSWMRNPYKDSIVCRMRQYKKCYESVKKAEKWCWKAFSFVVCLDDATRGKRYAKYGDTLKKLLAKKNFNFFDAVTLRKERMEDIERTFTIITTLKDFDLLSIIMGNKLDARAFRYFCPSIYYVNSRMLNQQLVSLFFQTQYSAFSATDSFGKTLLHYIAADGSASMAKEYLSQATMAKRLVDMQLPDNSGLTPIDYLVRRRQNQEAREMDFVFKDYMYKRSPV